VKIQKIADYLDDIGVSHDVRERPGNLWAFTLYRGKALTLETEYTSESEPGLGEVVEELLHDGHERMVAVKASGQNASELDVFLYWHENVAASPMHTALAQSIFAGLVESSLKLTSFFTLTELADLSLIVHGGVDDVALH